MLKAATSPTGGWTKLQAIILGFKGFEKGWVARAEGMEICDDTYAKFYNAGTRRRNRRLKNTQSAIASLDSVIPKETHRTPVNTSFNKVKRDTRNEFYNCDDWKDIRVLALRRGGYKCAYCGQTGKTTVLHVDHIVPLTVDWTRRLDLLNLQVLCADCNIGKRNYHCDTGPI